LKLPSLRNGGLPNASDLTLTVDTIESPEIRKIGMHDDHPVAGVASIISKATMTAPLCSKLTQAIQPHFAVGFLRLHKQPALGQ